MCGITGRFSFSAEAPDSTAELDRSIAVLRHRGPDSNGKFTTEQLQFGHCRLAIIDLSEAGNQPMSDAEGETVLIYNGECYNYQTLREELQAKGCSFRTDSDTEVVLQLLKSEGVNGLNRINGFFALAWYRKKENTLLLARDRFGIKPLYFYQDNHHVIFSSELKGIHPFQPATTISRLSLNAYLHLNYIPAPHTIFNEVKKIMPGQYLEVLASGEVRNGTYYKLEPSSQKVDEKDGTELLKKTLENSVQQRLVADVPVGCFLSGGIDSSILTAVASQFKPDLKTFTLSFKDLPQYDESQLARIVAEKFKTDHTELEITSTDLLNSIPSILANTDDPFADSSAIAMYNLCKTAGQHVKVALSGDGGDELFAGYNKHRAFNLLFNNPSLKYGSLLLNPILSSLPQSRTSNTLNLARKFARLTQAGVLNGRDQYWFLAGYRNENLSLLKDDVDIDAASLARQFIPEEIRSLDEVLLKDVGLVLEGDMLVKTDRNSMAHGLEVRVPFLDHRVVEAAFSLPKKLKLGREGSKAVLRRAYGSSLPQEILEQPKHGFEVPLRNWLREDLKPLLQDLLDPDLLSQQGIFKQTSINELVARLGQFNSENSEQVLWNLMVFNNWWKGHQNIPIQ